MTTGRGAADDYRLAVFGSGSLLRGGSPVRLRSRRTLALAWYVGSTRSGVSRVDLAQLLWPAAAASVARGNLRVVLSTLHTQASGLLQIGGDRVRRGEAHLVLDTDEFESLCRTAVGGADLDERLSAVTDAADLLAAGVCTTAESVPSPQFRAWVDAERNRLQLRFVDAVAVLGEELMGSPRASEALDAARLAAGFDEFNAAVQLLIASGLAATGDVSGAREHLFAAQSSMATDPRAGPDAEVAVLADGPRARHSSLVRVLDHLDPLPPREQLFGRARLVERVEAALARAGSQVTLTGAGGVGKTSLATELAHRARDLGRDVVVVDLVAVTDPAAASRVVADGLGARPQGRGDRDALTEHGTLLVLDNFEHLLGAGPLIGELLQQRPTLAVLVTSRVPLRVTGETVIVVPSLGLGEHGTGSAAVQMFRERARACGVAPEQLDASGARELCRLVDGLPLAIELAAAQCAALGLPAVLDIVRGALDLHDLTLLHAVDPGIAIRHSSLDAVVGETLSLLAPDALEVLAVAAVFDGPFTADALITVAAGRLGPSVAKAAMAELSEASLIRATSSRAPGAPVWHRLPPPVRAVAARMLDERPDREEILRARIDHDRGVARDARAALSGVGNASTHRKLDRYLPSLRATYDRLAAAGDPRRLELLAGVLPYRWAIGDVATCASWLRHAALGEQPAAGEDRVLWASVALWREATDAEMLGLPSSPGAIDELVDRVLHLVSQLDRSPVTGGAGSAAIAAIHTLDAAGRSLDALSLVPTARRIAAASPALLASVDYHEAKLLHGLGGDAAADVLLRQIIAGADQHGNRRCALEAGLLADLVGVTGSRGGQRETLAELLDEAMLLGDRRQVIWTLVSLGAVDVLDGRLPDAVGWFRQALGVSRPFAYALGLGSCLLGGAAIALLRGDVEVAQVFDGSLDGELPALNRALPRAYVDAYRVVHQDLADRRRDDRALAGAWSRGRTLPRSPVIEQLDRYLAGRTGGPARPATDTSGVAALRAVSRGEA